MTIKCTGGETGEYVELAMPKNLTSDLPSVSKLMSQKNFKRFSLEFLRNSLNKYTISAHSSWSLDQAK